LVEGEADKKKKRTVVKKHDFYTRDSSFPPPAPPPRFLSTGVGKKNGISFWRQIRVFFPRRSGGGSEFSFFPGEKLVGGVGGSILEPDSHFYRQKNPAAAKYPSFSAGPSEDQKVKKKTRGGGNLAPGFHGIKVHKNVLATGFLYHPHHTMQYKMLVASSTPSISAAHKRLRSSESLSMNDIGIDNNSNNHKNKKTKIIRSVSLPRFLHSTFIPSLSPIPEDEELETEQPIQLEIEQAVRVSLLPTCMPLFFARSF
jgi:hypothetical protein